MYDHVLRMITPTVILNQVPNLLLKYVGKTPAHFPSFMMCLSFLITLYLNCVTIHLPIHLNTELRIMNFMTGKGQVEKLSLYLVPRSSF